MAHHVWQGQKIENTLNVSLSELKVSYAFDAIVPPDISQAEFAEFFAENVNHFLQSMSKTILAIGSSGSGKSYTMSGTGKGDQGLIGNIIAAILPRISDTHMVITITASEVTSKGVNDLLTKRWNSISILPFTRDSLTKRIIRSTNDIDHLLYHVRKRRITNPTATNPASSRSHQIITITIDDDSSTHGAEMVFVDLAGLEKLNESDRDVSLFITSSLSALFRVINAISRSNERIPYRDSLLTMCLKSTMNNEQWQLEETYNLFAAIKWSLTWFHRKQIGRGAPPRWRIDVSKVILSTWSQWPMVENISR